MHDSILCKYLPRQTTTAAERHGATVVSVDPESTCCSALPGLPPQSHSRSTTLCFETESLHMPRSVKPLKALPDDGGFPLQARTARDAAEEFLATFEYCSSHVQ